VPRPAPAPFRPKDPHHAELLSLARPEHTARGLFLSSVLAAAEALGGPEARARVAEVVGERRVFDLLSYPVEHVQRGAFAAAELLAPRLGGAAAALRHIGLRSVAGWLESAPGRTVMQLGGSDVRRFLLNAPMAYRMAVSYGERTVAWEGPTHAVLHVRGDYMPAAYHEGILQGALERTPARNVRVEGLRAGGPLDARYSLRWD
jgi:uncharacterized protein (TIGR02265 family)